jgi:hypothetical protein
MQHAKSDLFLILNSERRGEESRENLSVVYKCEVSTPAVLGRRGVAIVKVSDVTDPYRGRAFDVHSCGVLGGLLYVSWAVTLSSPVDCHHELSMDGLCTP